MASDAEEDAMVSSTAPLNFWEGSKEIVDSEWEDTDEDSSDEVACLGNGGEERVDSKTAKC